MQNEIIFLREELKIKNHILELIITSKKWSGVMVTTTTYFIQQSVISGSAQAQNPACGVSEIRGGEDLWQWFRLEIRLNALFRSIIPQKQFIIIYASNQQIGHHTQKISNEKRCCSININGNNNITIKPLTQKIVLKFFSKT